MTRAQPRDLEGPGQLDPSPFPYTLERRGVLMRAQKGRAEEAWGVLNPATARDGSGQLWLFPRVVAEGNVSRVGRARILLGARGAPVGVERDGIALEPQESWEANARTAGVEDPRITRVDALGCWVMTYAAYGPLGGRIALATSSDLRRWERLGPVSFAYEPTLRTDLNLFPNKDALLFSEPVPGPDGRPSVALLHRPLWDLGWVRPGEGVVLPAGVHDPRPGIWVSFAPLEEVLADRGRLTRFSGHRLVALPTHAWEATKIGGGTPPVRVPEGWLVIHHGVTGTLTPGLDHQPDVRYSAGAMILDPLDVSHVLHRSAEPLLEPHTPEERNGIVDEVVFPTAIEPRDGGFDVFYGMADERIGLARLLPTAQDGEKSPLVPKPF